MVTDLVVNHEEKAGGVLQSTASLQPGSGVDSCEGLMREGGVGGGIPVGIQKLSVPLPGEADIPQGMVRVGDVEE